MPYGKGQSGQDWSPKLGTNFRPGYICCTDPDPQADQRSPGDAAERSFTGSGQVLSADMSNRRQGRLLFFIYTMCNMLMG